MTAALLQISLVAFGLAALYMAFSKSDRQRRYAPVVGLCGQPAWVFYATDAHAWGLLALSLAYSAVYVRGAYLMWRPA